MLHIEYGIKHRVQLLRGHVRVAAVAFRGNDGHGRTRLGWLSGDVNWRVVPIGLQVALVQRLRVRPQVAIAVFL